MDMHAQRELEGSKQKLAAHSKTHSLAYSKDHSVTNSKACSREQSKARSGVYTSNPHSMASLESMIKNTSVTRNQENSPGIHLPQSRIHQSKVNEFKLNLVEVNQGVASGGTQSKQQMRDDVVCIQDKVSYFQVFDEDRDQMGTQNYSTINDISQSARFTGMQEYDNDLIRMDLDSVK